MVQPDVCYVFVLLLSGPRCLPGCTTKRMCVWANSVIPPVVKLCVCVPVALTQHATPSHCELCLLTTLRGLYSLVLGVCVCQHASRELDRKMRMLRDKLREMSDRRK